MRGKINISNNSTEQSKSSIIHSQARVQWLANMNTNSQTGESGKYNLNVQVHTSKNYESTNNRIDWSGKQL